jgi:hypothetical protein
VIVVGCNFLPVSPAGPVGQRRQAGTPKMVHTQGGSNVQRGVRSVPLLLPCYPVFLPLEKIRGSALCKTDFFIHFIFKKILRAFFPQICTIHRSPYYVLTAVIRWEKGPIHTSSGIRIHDLVF